MKGFLCKVCGHIELDSIPDKCPVCFSPSTAFSEQDVVKTIKDEGPKEKHVPVIAVNKKCKLIPAGCTEAQAKIGEAIHPMEPAHFIQWADFYVDMKWVARAHLTPECNPAASAFLKAASGTLTVIEKCNIHGHWIGEMKL